MEHNRKFEIQIPDIEGCIKNARDPSDVTVGYAIESLFPIEEEAYMYWNGFKIRLSMKYDIGEIWRDMILMITHIKRGKKKEFTIHWPSSSFFAAWEFTIMGDVIQIKAYWTDVNVDRGGLYKLREEDTPILINKEEFLKEWYKIMIPIKNAILASGYNIKKLKDFKHSFSLID